MMGNPPEACVKRAEEAGAALIGANCGSGIEDYVPLAPILRGLTTLPLWIKANAGIPQIVGGKVVVSPDRGAVCFLRARPGTRGSERDRRLLRNQPFLHQRDSQGNRGSQGTIGVGILLFVLCGIAVSSAARRSFG